MTRSLYETEISLPSTPTHFKARVLRQSGGIPYASNLYELTTPWRPSNREVADAQRSLGYDPLGYGAPERIRRKQFPSGRWVTVWESAASCD